MANRALGEPRLTGPQPLPKEAVAVGTQAAAKPLITAGDSRVADRAFYFAMLGCALSVIGIVGLIVYELITKSNLSWHAFGWRFFFRSDWDPVNDQFGAFPFVYGTLVSSALALLIAVPLAIGVAVYITEMSPRGLRGALAFTTELLAAIPSVIYGLWAIFVLVPLLRQYVQPFLARYFGWTTLFEGPPYGIGMLAAGIILAIMVVPIISSITREVMTAVPQQQREAVLALGATRWEMIRTGVLRNARAGIAGGVILGLGRALGETMAVTMVIGNRPEIAKSLFAPGYTMASVIANEFSEATGDLYLSALVEVGLALFIVTIIVNILAQFLVWTVTRGTPARGNA
ncbi:MAG TPA: phosphate ABC transporter permease subunit PstC [Terriglobales bacterium]|jgi:phosphate transport system permease protein|nr:phosphate ABC transporter permease subunit PstC [Terriglobales bacterium]